MDNTLIIHLSDTHFNPLNKIPISCKDNYHQIVKNEFNELKNQIVELKKTNKVSIAISGDIFNLKKQHFYSPKDITYYSELIENTFQDSTVYCIYGNHDASTEDVVFESSYNLLCKATKNIIDISNKTIKINDQITISGIPFCSLDLVKEKTKSLILDNTSQNIVLFHADIFKSIKEVDWYLESFLSYDDIITLNSNINYALLGHIHKTTEPYKLNNTWFSKPHAFSRMAKDYLSKENIESYYPGYAIINPMLSTLEYKYIDIHKVSEFIDFNELEKIKENSKKLNIFIDTLKEKYSDINSIFNVVNPDDLYASMPISNEIKEILNKYLC